MQEYTDSDLIAAYANSGDEKAFAELVSRHQRMVYRVCLRMLGHHQDAEDATQAVFLVLLHKANRLTRQGELTGWFYGVARNVALQALQRRARRKEEAMRDEAEEIEMDSNADRESALRSLDESLAGLSGVLRQAVALRYLQGYDQAEAARRAGCSTGTLASRASRGIERLRARLAKRGVALSGAALASLLASEASAAIPETVLPSILATVKGAVATTAAGTIATTTAGMLAKGAMKAMFIAQVKTAALVTAAAIAMGGAGVTAVVAVDKEQAKPSVPASGFHVPVAATFSSKAWRNDEASHDLARAGIRVFQIGGWGPGGSSGWATPAELRRRTMPATNYVNAWATSQEREVLWMSSNTVAIIGTKAELDALKQQAGGDAASTEAIHARLGPNAGPPPADRQRAAWEPEQDQATLRKAFHAAQGQAKVDAAIKLCAAGGDDGLAFLKAELSREGAVTSKMSTDYSWADGALEALGAHGGPEAIEVLKAFLSDKQASRQSRSGMALGRNASDAAVEVLRTALKSDDVDTAFGAACGLEMLGGKHGLELAGLALAHADPKVRRAGAFGAYRAHGERALPLLEKALTDKDDGVRKEAMNGLEQIGSEKARALIRRQ